MKFLQTQQLLERLSSLLRSERRSVLFQHGLKLVQFEALHYLSICNRYSDTPMSVTEYLNQTKGSVSQSLKVLERKGLITKTTDSVDKRVAHLQVTKTGRQLVADLLASDQLNAALGGLGDAEISKVNASLSAILKSVQATNGFRSFGQCATCRHHKKLAANEFLCGLTEEQLTVADTELICREHEYHKPRSKVA